MTLFCIAFHFFNANFPSAVQCFWAESKSICVLSSGESDGAGVSSVSVWCSRVQFLPESGYQEEANHHHGPLSKYDTKCCLPEKGSSQSGPTKDVYLWCCIPLWCLTGEIAGYLKEFRDFNLIQFNSIYLFPIHNESNLKALYTGGKKGSTNYIKIKSKLSNFFFSPVKVKFFSCNGHSVKRRIFLLIMLLILLGCTHNWYSVFRWLKKGAFWLWSYTNSFMFPLDSGLIR